MTHLVALAGGIIERRGGMRIHGAIISGELGIPCVNGVRDAAGILKNGDLVTVDGHLGIVTVGANTVKDPSPFSVSTRRAAGQSLRLPRHRHSFR
jgi:phosphohistidine swiveling domain-containing protein